MGDDLHSTVRTAVDEARRLAQAATPGPWTTSGPGTIAEWSVYSEPRGWMVFSACVNDYPDSEFPKLRGGITGDEANDNAAFIAYWSPARALAMCDWADDVLARHHAWDFNGQPSCDYCENDFEDTPAVWPCVEVRSVAAAFGVETGETP